MANINNQISFIIPVYNAEKTLSKSIDSVINGNFVDGDEIIIVDDASNDNSLSIIHSYCNKYPFIKLLKHNYNKGSAASGRNTAIDVAKNELLFCLDADNVLRANSIAKLKEFMNETKADIAAFGEIHYFKESVDQVTEVWKLDSEITFISNINRMVYSPAGSGNYLFTKQSWIKAGRYNESIGGAWDSWAFGCSQLAAGCTMRTLENTYYYHKHGYESTFIRDNKKISYSLNVGRLLIPYFHLIHPDDVDYILNPCFRNTWLKSIHKRQIREVQIVRGRFDQFVYRMKQSIYYRLGKFR